MRRRIRSAQKTLLVYENAATGKRYEFRKVDAHTYVYTKEDGTRESVGVYRIKKGDWNFIPEASSITRIRPSV